MAIKRLTQVVDDLDGSVLEGGEVRRVRFALGGRAYEMDLSPENAKKLHEIFAPYIASGRRVHASPTSFRRNGAKKADLTAVRAWARKHGHMLSERAPVPATVIEAHRSATR